MKNALQHCSAWTRGRFLWVIGALFVLQAGLIFLFGERTRPEEPLLSPPVQFHALESAVNEDELLRQFFVGDPAVFSLPHRRGFSGRGWMNQQPLEYQPQNQLEPPRWLPLQTALLGVNFTVPPAGGEAVPAGFPDDQEQVRREEAPPDFLPPEIVATQSVFRIEGALGERLLGVGPSLPAWPSERILTNSFVQIAVDAMGQVMAARLDGSSGSSEADADAVAKARALRFRPSRLTPTQWGEAVFQWQITEPPAATPPK